MVCTAARMRSCSLWFVGIVFNVSSQEKNHRVSGPVTSVARVEYVQIFLKDPVFNYNWFYLKHEHTKQDSSAAPFFPCY